MESRLTTSKLWTLDQNRNLHIEMLMLCLASARVGEVVPTPRGPPRTFSHRWHSAGIVERLDTASFEVSVNR